MLPKLQQFYFKFLLPELASPRYDTYSDFRNPVASWFDVSLKKTQPAVQSQCITDPNPGLSKHPTPCEQSCSKNLDCPTTSKSSVQQTRPVTLSRRTKGMKYVGRQILHKWLLYETTKETKWYSGVVLDVIKGADGEPEAEYNVLYKGEDSAYEVEDLYSDYLKGWLKFMDV